MSPKEGGKMGPSFVAYQHLFLLTSENITQTDGPASTSIPLELLVSTLIFFSYNHPAECDLSDLSCSTIPLNSLGTCTHGCYCACSCDLHKLLYSYSLFHKDCTHVAVSSRSGHGSCVWSVHWQRWKIYHTIHTGELMMALLDQLRC